MNISFMTRLCAALCLLATVQVVRAQDEPMPTWPRQFTVVGQQDVSFGFMLTQPGPIVVDVQANGGPVVALLEGPAQRPVAQQQGSGALRLAYTATPNEVQNGSLWIVRVALASPGPNGAKGIVNAQYPPADPGRVLAVTRSFKGQSQSRRAQSDSAGDQQRAQLKARLDADLRDQNAQLEQQNVQRRNALMAQLQPTVDRLRASGAVTSAPRVSTRAVAPSGGSNRFPGATLPPPDRGQIIRELPPATSPPPPPPPPPANPAIASLSAGSGRPGDPILINGSGFGNTVGEVHFVVGPTNDVAVPANAPGLVWSDSQIFLNVPSVTGVPASNGTVYVKRASDQVRSNLAQFAFVPLLERRQIRVPNPSDVLFGQSSVAPYFYPIVPHQDRIARHNQDCFSGHAGNDRLFMNTRLQNGWRVSAAPTVEFQKSYHLGGGAALSDSRVGTDWPYLDVYWWLNPGPYCSSTVAYWFVIPIEGPQNTPDGVAVK